jgi:hypothetical protein
VAADAYLSSNRTCEIGLCESTGAPYESFLLLEGLSDSTAHISADVTDQAQRS